MRCGWQHSRHCLVKLQAEQRSRHCLVTLQAEQRSDTCNEMPAAQPSIHMPCTHPTLETPELLSLPGPLSLPPFCPVPLQPSPALQCSRARSWRGSC